MSGLKALKTTRVPVRKIGLELLPMEILLQPTQMGLHEITDHLTVEDWI
jgi:hypothetical protein